MNITHGKATDFVAFKAGPTTADASTAATGPYHSISGARQFSGVASVPAVLQGSTVTVRLLQATAAGGTGSKLLAETEVVIPEDDPAITAPYTVTVNAVDSALDDAGGVAFVAVEVETSVAVAASGLLMLSGLRYSPEPQAGVQ